MTGLRLFFRPLQALFSSLVSEPIPIPFAVLSWSAAC
jgi:hypothetical protein